MQGRRPEKTGVVFSGILTHCMRSGNGYPEFCRAENEADDLGSFTAVDRDSPIGSDAL
jgi:hypothetical protein